MINKQNKNGYSPLHYVVLWPDDSGKIYDSNTKTMHNGSIIRVGRGYGDSSFIRPLEPSSFGRRGRGRGRGGRGGGGRRG